MRYSFEELSEDEFEALVVDICQKLFGTGVHSFTKGKDGGRDCYFFGTADFYPSTQSPWKGRIIIQAKHTTNILASCSDKDFFTNKTSTLNVELEKIKKRKAKEDINGYLLITNRKLTGGTHPEIIQLMEKTLGLTQVNIMGIEDLAMYMDSYPILIQKYRLSRYEMPNQFYEKDIRDVIVLFSKKSIWPKHKPTCSITKGITYIDKIRKNELNGVDEDYFSDIKAHSLMYFDDIDRFLKDPKNNQYLKLYLNTVDELRLYLRANKKDYSFVELLDKIIKEIIGTDYNAEIFKSKALVTIFVHYMYWNCDLGKTE